MDYELCNDDALLLRYVGKLLREYGENDIANDVTLLKERIIEMLKN